MQKIKANKLLFSTLLISSFILFTLLCYFPAIKGPFVYDDHHNIVNNAHIKNWSHFSDIITSSSGAGSNKTHSNFYRPMKTLTYLTIHSVFGLNPAPFHIVSIILHSLCGFLVFYLLSLLNIPRLLSYLLALVFLTHPTHSEAVAYISGIADPLGTVFMLSSIIFFHRGLNSDKPLKMCVYSYVFFLLSLLSKESFVITAPILCSMLFLCDHKTQNKKIIINYLILTLGTTFLYLFLKFTIFNFTSNRGLSNNEYIYESKLSLRLLTFIHVIYDYLGLLLFPKYLSLSKASVLYTQIDWTRFIIGCSTILTFIGVLIKSKNKTIKFGILWVCFSISPFIGIIPMNATYLEHWLYVPIIGLLIITTCPLLSLIKERKQIIFIVLTIIIVASCFRTHKQAQVYQSELSYYLNNFIVNPNDPRANINLGTYYLREFKKSRSEKLFNTSLKYYNNASKISKNKTNLYYNLGSLYALANNFDISLQYLNQSLKRNPKSEKVKMAIEYVYFLKKTNDNNKNKEKEK